MSQTTSIEWCDSTVNPVMGCDGCELWDAAGKVRACYAGALHERYGHGRSTGYAFNFLKPEKFVGRMAQAARWKDLTGTKRPEKPWLDGLPRVVFISDMGDALSRSVPFDYLKPEVIDIVARWPHIGMWLTKQPQRMAEFAGWLRGHWADRLWAGASLTDPRRQGARVDALRLVPAAVRFLSVEPLLADPGALDLFGISLVIVGGESGTGARPCDLAWIRSIVEQCKAAGVPCFVKQVGARPYIVRQAPNCTAQDADERVDFTPRDRKGGDPVEWPADLRVREFPAPAEVSAR